MFLIALKLFLLSYHFNYFQVGSSLLDQALVGLQSLFNSISEKVFGPSRNEQSRLEEQIRNEDSEVREILRSLGYKDFSENKSTSESPNEPEGSGDDRLDQDDSGNENDVNRQSVQENIEQIRNTMELENKEVSSEKNYDGTDDDGNKDDMKEFVVEGDENNEDEENIAEDEKIEENNEDDGNDGEREEEEQGGSQNPEGQEIEEVVGMKFEQGKEVKVPKSESFGCKIFYRGIEDKMR